jgi:hypothetical protein
MAYNPVPNIFQNATSSLPLSQLDADFAYVSGKIVSVADYGAVGNGTTDDYAAVQAALTSSPSGSTVVIPANMNCRVSAGVVVPAGKTLMGGGFGPNVVNTTSMITGDLAVTPVVTLDGGGASVGVNLRNIGVSRAAGTVPTSSIGVLVQNSNQAVLQDVVVYRCDIGIKLLTTLGVHLSRCNTTIISGTHLWIEGSQQVHAIATYCGRNGGNDVSCNEYVRIKGNSDTVKFTQCQFNLSGGTASRAVYFDTYASANGIIGFSQCHFENNTTVVSQTGTTSVMRAAFNSCTVNSAAQSLNVPSGFFTELVIVGCPFWAGPMTLDQCVSSRVMANRFYGDVILNQGSGAFIGNDCLGNLTVQGICAGLSVIGNNRITGGKTFANTATGQVSCDIENTSFVPVITSGTGAFTTVSATMRYTIVGSAVRYFIEITDTTNNTAATNVRYTLPYTPNSNACASGVETTTGKTVSATWQSGISKMVTVFYDNTYPGANGNVIQLNGSYTITV